MKSKRPSKCKAPRRVGSMRLLGRRIYACLSASESLEAAAHLVLQHRQSFPGVGFSGLLSRIVCKWKGHDIVNATELWYCRRCGIGIDYDEAVKTPWRTRLLDWLKARKDWWKCPECGLRFGKHNDVPHIP